MPARPSRGRNASAREVAALFAAAYARYLGGRLPADQLRNCTPTAQALVAQGGRLPARLRRKPLRVLGVLGGGSSWTARFAANGARAYDPLSAQLTLTHPTSGCQVAAVDPPDPDEVLAAARPAAPSVAPTAARTAALAFIISWLGYSYGHATPAQLLDLTASLGCALGSRPPHVPPAIRGLHPHVASLTLGAIGTRWLASATITDGQNTYQVTTVVGQTRGRWLAVAARLAG